MSVNLMTYELTINQQKSRLTVSYKCSVLEKSAVRCVLFSKLLRRELLTHCPLEEFNERLDKKFSSFLVTDGWGISCEIGFGDYTDLLWWMWFKQLVLPIDH